MASADVSGLVPCKDSAVFKKRLDGSVKKLTTRLENYEEGTPAYLALEAQNIVLESSKVAELASSGSLFIDVGRGMESDEHQTLMLTQTSEYETRIVEFFSNSLM